jgi:hypothetical protein
MRRQILTLAVLAVTTAGGAALSTALAGESAVLSDYGNTPPAPAPAPSRGSSERARGVAWLVKEQRADGGWSSGNFGTDGRGAASDVATTAWCTLALFRDANGSDANRGAIVRGVSLVVDRVMSAPPGPRLDTPTGTQIQYKLGELVDTHLAALLLGEVSGKLDPATNRRVATALDIAAGKVQLAQRADGSFDTNGWAPVLSSSIASQSLEKANALGVDVDEQVLAKADDYRASTVQGGTFDASEGAGVQLYAVAAAARGNSQTAQRTGDGAPKADAKGKAEAATSAALGAVARDDGRLIAGYGTLGGEEMLSYSMLSDTLAEKGGAEWRAWETKIAAYLQGVQTQDGSWVGSHCVTSAAFTTAGAIVTLTAGDHAASASRM